MGVSPLEAAFAEAIVFAPNRGRAAPTVAFTGETLVEVGPPAATLSLEIVSATVPRATIFLLHGVRDSKRSLLALAERFAAAGYRAVIVDSRGHGRSSGDALTYGVQESKDLAQLLGVLASRGVASGPIGAFGFSYGASTAIQWAARDARVSAVVAAAPFTSLRDVAPRYLPVPLPGDFIRRAIDLAGEKGAFDPDAASPLSAAASTNAALLLVHGKDDWRIPAGHSERIYRSCKSRSRSALVVVPGTGHNAVLASRKADLASRAAAWFDVHL
jgi:alpha-beta hydrolase superfamily lysophospholipase